MVGGLLLRGMMAGVLAGLLAFGFARTFGEPWLDRAIAFEQRASAAAGEAPEPEMVSCETQAGIGLLAGIVVYGAAIGGLLALAFAFANGRLGGIGPRGTAALLALAGGVSLVLVPGLKYPANPPGVGASDTIVTRTELYFVMLAMSVAALLVAVALARRLWASLGPWNAAMLAGAVYVVAVAAAAAALPAIDEVPEQFSALLLWNFRMAGLGLQAVFWTALGLAFGALCEQRSQTASNSRYVSPPAR